MEVDLIYSFIVTNVRGLVVFLLGLTCGILALMWWADPLAFRQLRDDLIRWVREKFDG